MGFSAHVVPPTGGPTRGNAEVASAFGMAPLEEGVRVDSWEPATVVVEYIASFTHRMDALETTGEGLHRDVLQLAELSSQLVNDNLRLAAEVAELRRRVDALEVPR